MSLLRKLLGVVLVVIGLGMVVFSFGMTVATLVQMAIGGVILIAGIALVGSRELGELVNKFLKPQP